MSIQNGTLSAHGGEYYGANYYNGSNKSTASITTNSKINPQVIRFYVTKATDNTTSSSWKVQTSADGIEWTDRKTQDATSMNPSTWVEVTQDLSSYSDVYVRIYYGSAGALRAIDDLVISGATYDSDPDCVFDYFIDIMHDNATIGKQGTYSAPSALSDATSGDDYCMDKHYHFLGWVNSEDINDDGTLKDGYTLIPADDDNSGSGYTADNKTFYAIWVKEEK